MKKLMSIFMAAVSVLTMSTAAMAESVPTERATVTFDTDKCMSYIYTFGNASDTNLSYSVTADGSQEGRALKIEEDFTDKTSNQYGGIYFDSKDFGLDSFAGYTMTLSMKTNKASAKATDILVAFTDGDQWYSENYATSPTDKWTTVTISVPADKNNTKLGLSIPITEGFTGEVMMIDNMKLTDNYGKVLANIGDIDTSIAKAPNGAVSVLTTLLFVLLVAGVIAAVVLIVKKVFWRFR